MDDQIKGIQEDLIDYFKDMDNKTFVQVVDCLVYHNGTTDSKISKLIEKFLEDMGLTEAYLNYLMEIKKPSSFFVRHPSDIQMIEDIKKSFLSLSYNRFIKELDKPKSSPLTKLTRGEKDDLNMVIRTCESHNNDLIGDEFTTKLMFDEKEANELVDERKRLAKLFAKVLKLLK